jgi:hypothetical protein
VLTSTKNSKSKKTDTSDSIRTVDRAEQLKDVIR